MPFWASVVSLHPSSLLQVLDEATHRAFLEVQPLCQHLLRHWCLVGAREQGKHLGEREGEARWHLYEEAPSGQECSNTS